MKKVTLLIASAATLLFLASCGSTPKVEDSPAEAPVVQEETQGDQTTEEVVVDRDGIIAKIEEARKSALEAGAENRAPELLNLLDTIYEKVKSEDDISISGNDLALRYRALADYILAKDEKQKIDENDFASYDQKSYDEGVNYLALVEEAYNAEKWDSSVSKNAKMAYGKFVNVTFAAYKKLALEERALAFEAKRKADSVKAGVARKEAYKEAAKLFQSGDQLYAIQNPEKAYGNYKSAKERFTTLAEEVSEKRAAAQAKLEEAKRAVEESATFAEEADVTAPITEPVEGIEEEDTVLLEEDNYEDAEKSEADIPEFIDEESAVKAVVVEEEIDVPFEPQNLENTEDSEVEETEEVAPVEEDEVEVVEAAEEESVEVETESVTESETEEVIEVPAETEETVEDSAAEEE